MKKYIIFLAIISFKLCAQQADILVKQNDAIFSLPHDTALQSQLLRDTLELQKPGKPSLVVPSHIPMKAIQELMQTFEKYKTLSGKALLDAVEKDTGTIKLTQELLNACDYLAFTPGIELIASSFARSKPNIQQLKENFDAHVISVIARYYYLLHEKDLKGIEQDTIGFSFQDYADYLSHVVTPKDNKLNLATRRLNHISPNDLKAFSNLQELHLSYNQLKERDPQIFSGLTNLITLHLEGNQLKNLAPQTFSSLSNLQRLDLSNNQLKELDPQTFSDLPNLQVLGLIGNQLKELAPQTFSGLTKLITLYLDDNQLKKLDPRTFSGLTNLQWLELNHNQLKELDPLTFSGLTNLQSLFLNHNQLTELDPRTFSGLTNLQRLHLNHNPLSVENKEKLGRMYGERVNI